MKNKADYQRKWRLKKAIKDLITNNYETSYFLTLTFNEKTLKNTTKEQRLLIIKSYLNNQTDKYILNCDYGAKNEREHYHALVIAKDKFINYFVFNAYYGHIRSRPIALNKNQSIASQTKILLNHALKETSERKIYYSRSKRTTHKPKNREHIKTNFYMPKWLKNEQDYIDNIKITDQLENDLQDTKLLKRIKEDEKKKLIKYANDILSFKKH